MSVQVQFINRSGVFLDKIAIFKDGLMALMAAGIENKMKTSGEIPYLPHAKAGSKAQSGALRASVRHVKLSLGHYAVTAGSGSVAAAYAAAQEAGTTRGFQIHNYSTAGTGPHYFQHAIDNVKDRRPDYIVAAKRAAGLE